MRHTEKRTPQLITRTMGYVSGDGPTLAQLEERAATGNIPARNAANYREAMLLGYTSESPHLRLERWGDPASVEEAIAADERTKAQEVLESDL